MLHVSLRNGVSWVALLVCLVGTLSLWPANTAQAQGDPPVSYTADNQTILVGSASGAPGSQPITLPALAAAVAAQGGAAAIVDQGNGVWLLNAIVRIQRTARLDIASPAVSELRIQSNPSRISTLTAEHGGVLAINGVKVTSWDETANAVDTNLADGRSYIQALDGARLEIINNSEIAYLGYGSGTTGGVSVRKLGATGRIENSRLHNNFIGLYASEALSLTISSNEISSNIESGLLIQDSSQAFVVSGNTVKQNGEHGIVLARGATNNDVNGNTVHDNTVHGILLDRTGIDNVVRTNEIYNNRDGVAISQASSNLIDGNLVRNNHQGIRVSASVGTLSTNNQVINNTVNASGEHGIYLYSNADRNLIRGNTIDGSTTNGLYIKSGGNRIESNIIRNGVTGLNITGGEAALVASSVDADYVMEWVDQLEVPATQNIVISNTIRANTGVGLRISGGSNNRIGSDPEAPSAGGTNLIENNAAEGVYITQATAGAASANNLIFDNIIRGNGKSGIALRDATTVGNRISQNSITDNAGSAIKLDANAQADLPAPVITRVLADGEAVGTAPAGATVEVYTDPADEAETLLGVTTADANGRWQIDTAATDPKQLTALAIDEAGNTSLLSARSGTTARPFYEVGVDENGQRRISVSTGPVTVSLSQVRAGLGSLNSENLLVELPNGVWRLNANLFVGSGVTLTIASAGGVNELQLRSQSSVTPTTGVDHASFVYLRTHDGALDLDGVKVYSWDEAANAPDQDPANGRAHLVAKYNAVMNIRNSELSYLGAFGGETAGVVWRDVNDVATPNALRTRVTGQVIDSKFHHNFYGVYLAQAGNMLFRGNEFYENLRYGFNPREASNHLTVENNRAYKNGSHGFLISQGVNHVVLRGNESFDNLDPSASQAHGFVLEPDEATVIVAAVTGDNVLEANAAYRNEGLGIRIIGSNNNELRNNRFEANGEAGISLEQGSTANTLLANTVQGNQSHGIVLRGTANSNLVASNVITGNVGHGIYVRSSNNSINENTVESNQLAGIALALESDLAPVLSGNTLHGNQVSRNLASGIDVRGALSTTLSLNQVDTNGEHGVYLTNGTGTSHLLQNEIFNNTGSGIRMSGAAAFSNSWSQNSIYANKASGIHFTGDVNPNIVRPTVTTAVECTVSGSARPGWTVEIFSSADGQGRFFLGETVANAEGAFSLDISGGWMGPQVTAIATDLQGNSTIFSASVPAPTDSACRLSYLPLISR